MTRLALLAIPMFAAACAGPASLAGKSESDLRASLGAPAAEYLNADGSRTLAYPQGSFGTQTYMAEVSPGGAVRGVRQALGEDTFQRINPGMTRDEVLRLIGPPHETMDFPRQRELSFEYRFRDAWGYPALFYVNFDPRGIVVSKFTRRIDPNPSRDR
jgi:outer membrane protein assembly factor BamE (lipoprotein component of BamABCDE complex)